MARLSLRRIFVWCTVGLLAVHASVASGASSDWYPSDVHGGAPSPVRRLTQPQFHSMREKPNHIFLVHYYDSTSSHASARALATEFTEAAKSLQGFLPLAAVDCAHEHALCDEQAVQRQQTPIIKFYSAGHASYGGPQGQVYQQGRDARAFVSFALLNLRNPTVQATDADYSQKCEEAFQTKPVAVTLFSDKRSTPSIFKSIAMSYADDFAFFEVRTGGHDSEKTKRLLQEYAISRFPTLVLQVGHDGRKERYAGEWTDITAIRKWINAHAPRENGQKEYRPKTHSVFPMSQQQEKQQQQQNDQNQPNIPLSRDQPNHRQQDENGQPQQQRDSAQANEAIQANARAQANHQQLNVNEAVPASGQPLRQQPTHGPEDAAARQAEEQRRAQDQYNQQQQQTANQQSQQQQPPVVHRPVVDKTNQRPASMSDEGQLTYLTGDAFDQTVVRSNQPWMLLFCDEEQEACAAPITAFQATARAQSNHVRFGYVDVRAEAQLAEAYDITQTPTVKYFDQHGQQRGAPPRGASTAHAYNGPLTGAGLSQHATILLGSDLVKQVISNEYDTWMAEPAQEEARDDEDDFVVRLVYFHFGGTIPSYLQALSYKWRHQLYVGASTHMDSGLVQQFGVTQIPSLFFYSSLRRYAAPTSPGGALTDLEFAPQRYEGLLTFNHLDAFVEHWVDDWRRQPKETRRMVQRTTRAQQRQDQRQQQEQVEQQRHERNQQAQQQQQQQQHSDL